MFKATDTEKNNQNSRIPVAIWKFEKSWTDMLQHAHLVILCIPGS